MSAGRVLAIAAVGALAAGLPTAAHAQRVLIAPSASAGLVLDDNLFTTAEPDARADTILRVTPGLSASRETATTYLFGEYRFDAERYQDNPGLTTPLARQTAGGVARVRTSARTTYTFSGGYDSTTTASELNQTTGLLTGRVRARRWYGGPQVEYAFTPVTSLTARYDLSDDKIAGERITTHAAEVRLAHALSPRNELRFEPFARQFIFEDLSLATGGGTIGWLHRLTPFTSILAQAGPRFSQGSTDVRPELEFELARRTEYTELSLSYVRSVTTAIGLNDVVDSQRVFARAGYHRPAVIDFTVQGGMYVNDFVSTARVYRVGVDLTRALGRAVAISASYSLDWQRGLYRLPAGTEPVIAGPAGPLGPSDPTMSPALTAVPLRKNLAMIQLIIAPTIRPSRQPPEIEPETDDDAFSGSNR
jgi:hypothetical protein